MRRFADSNNDLACDSLSEEMPCRWLDKALVVNRDLSLAAVWKVQAPNTNLLSDAECTNLHAAVRALLGSIGPGYDLQIIFDSESPHDEASCARLKRTAEHPFLRSILAEKYEQMRAGFASKRLRYFSVYVVLVQHTSVSRESMTAQAKAARARLDALAPKRNIVSRFALKARDVIMPLFNPVPEAQCTEREYLDARNRMLSKADDVDAHLVGTGFRPAILVGQDIVDLLFRFWYPKAYAAGVRARNFDESDLLPLSRYYLGPDAERLSDGGFLRIDGGYHKILTVRNPPQALDFTIWARLLSYYGLHSVRVISTLQPESVKERKAYLEDKLSVAKFRASKDSTYARAQDDIEAMLEQLGSGLEACFWGRTVLHVYGETKEEVETHVRNIHAAVAKNPELEGLEITPEDIAAWGYWRASQPGWTRERDRHRDIPYVATEAATMLPLIGHDPMFGANVGAIYETDTGSIANIEFQDDRFANYNILMCGGSGSGKTYLANDMLAQFSARGDRVICIDFKKPGSFRAMSKARGGNYIDFDLDSTANRLNPFDLPVGEKPSTAQVEAIVDGLCKRIAEPGIRAGQVLEEERTALERTLQSMIIQADGVPFYMRDYVTLLQKVSPDLAKRLQPWVGENRYGKLGDGQSNISLDSPFTVFDFEKIVGNKHLCGVMFATVINQAMNLGLRSPGTRKFLVFDEAWELLADPLLGLFIVRAFRVLRSGGFSVMGISQGVEEFAKTENKAAILNNISHIIALRQNSVAAADALGTELGFNSKEVRRARGLRMVAGEYSEALVVQKHADDDRHRSTVILNRASPLTYWACTTRGHEREKVNELVGSGLGYYAAIEQLAKQYPAGIRA